MKLTLPTYLLKKILKILLSLIHLICYLTSLKKLKNKYTLNTLKNSPKNSWCTLML